MLATILLIATVAVPPPPATLIGHTVLTSEDGKHAVQVLTVGFPFDNRGRGVLISVMNSDSYWDHFRHWLVYLRVGDRALASGPRLATSDPWGFRRKAGDPRPMYDWTVSFALPADLKLAGAELEFCHYQDHGNGKIGPADTPFATLKLSEKEVKAAARPMRATVKEAGLVAETDPRNKDRHYVLFSLNHLPSAIEWRVGEVTAERLPGSIWYGEGKGYRHQGQDEMILRFSKAPPADAPVRVQFRDVPGLYKLETVVEKPKEKK